VVRLSGPSSPFLLGMPGPPVLGGTFWGGKARPGPLSWWRRELGPGCEGRERAVESLECAGGRDKRGEGRPTKGRRYGASSLVEQ
jgi:hypothetical protein